MSRAGRDAGRGRLPGLRPESLDDEQRAVYEAVAGGARAGGAPAFALTEADGALVGPFNAMLLVPSVGGPLQELGAALRYRGTLPDRARELVILAVAAHWECGFERRAHEAVGARVGLSPEEMAAVAEGRPAALDDPAEEAALRTARTLLREGGLGEGEYEALRGRLGEPALFEITALVGYYAMLALHMRVFGVESGPG